MTVTGTSVPRGRIPGLAAPLAAVAACLFLAAAPARAEGVPDKDARAQAIEGARSDPAALSHQAEAEKRALSALKRKLVTTADIILGIEARLTRIEETLPRLETEERIATAAMAARRGEVVRMVSAMQRLARRPANSPAAHPQDPVGILRGRLLLATAMPALDRDARDLAGELKNLAGLRTRLARERRQHHDAVRGLREERRILAALVEIRSGRGARQNEAAQAGAGGPAPGMQSVEDLIGRLENARRATRLRPEDLVPSDRDRKPARMTSAAPPAVASPVASRSPAAGPVVVHFGEPGENGWTAQGVTVRTRHAALVVAPRAGTVVFAEPFLGYGELLIIDHGEGYHVLLTGLERLDARVGDDLVSGEPIGIMGSDARTADRLYIELRRGGRPVDPLPWLTENSDKVGG